MVERLQMQGRGHVGMCYVVRPLLVVILCAITSGCATGRLADLRDCGKVSVGVGLGLGVQARVGAITHPSLGVTFYGPRIGFENRHLAGTWRETEGYWPVGAPFVLCSGPSTDPHPQGFNLSYSRICDPYQNGADEVFRSGGWGNVVGGDDPSTSSFNRATDLEVGVSLLLVSGRVGVNPLEILDFLLGFVGLDIANDDPE